MIVLIAAVVMASQLTRPCTGQAGPGEADLAQLIKDLRDADILVAANAATELGNRKTESEETVPWLLIALGDHRPIPLQAIRDHHQAVTIGSLASQSLSQIGLPAVEALKKVVVEASEPETRGYAIQALGGIGRAADSAIPTLVNVLDQQEDDSNRFQALAAILSISQNSKQTLKTIVAALRDRDPDIRVLAIRAIVPYGTAAAEAVPELIRSLDDRSVYFEDLRSETVAGAACQTLAEMGAAGRPAIPKLRRLLHDDDEYLRADAALAYARLAEQDEEALDVLMELAQSKSRGLGPASKAIQAIGRLGPRGARAEPLLIKLLECKDSLIRTRAARAIAAISPDHACRLLLPLCTDSDAGVRSATVSLLGACRPENKQAFDAVLKALDDESDEVRLASINQLARGGVHAADALAAMQRRLQEERTDWLRQELQKAIQDLQGTIVR